MEVRTTLWILVFLGFWMNETFRSNVSIAIIAMVKRHAKNQNQSVECTNMYSNSSLYQFLSSSGKPSRNQTTYYWDEYEQGVILSSFFWLHWLTQIPGGILAHRYGTKLVFGMMIFWCAVLNLVIPLAANLGFSTLVAVRLLQGFLGGATWSSMPPMTAKWIPPRERAVFLTSLLGGSAGTAFTYATSGYIIEGLGWEYTFYIQAVMGIAWSIAWKVLVYDSPSQHPNISVKEKSHILNGIGNTASNHKLPIPWKSILTSRPVWVNFISSVGTLWGLFTLLILSPSYLKYIHGLDLKATGLLSGIPHMTRWMFASVFGNVIQRQKLLSLKNSRKLATFLCTFGTGSMILVVSFSSCNVIMAVSALLVAVTLLGTQGAGPVATFIDMSPNFSGILSGMNGTAGVLSGFVSPILLGYLTKNNQTSGQWQKFFIIISFICCTSGLMDLFFGTSELQPWNNVKPQASADAQELKSTTEELLPATSTSVTTTQEKSRL